MSSIDDSTTTSHSPRLAFANTQAERDAIPADGLIRPNIDLQQAVVVAFGALKRISPYRGAILSVFPGFRIEKFDRLLEYTLQAEYALTSTSVPRVSVDKVAEWTVELGEKRATLFADIDALIRRGFLAPGITENMRGAKGIRNIAFDVQLFAGILLNALPAAAGKTGATEEELVAAEDLAISALQAVGEREYTPESPEGQDIRRRAFKLFSNAYDEVRRAMAYLRADAGDIDDLMPSLYAGRGGGTRKADASAASNDGGTAGAPASNGAPVGGSASNGAPVNGATPNGAASNGAPSHTTSTAPGFPGAPPFVDSK